MIPIPELKDLSTYTTERLESELVDAVISIGAIKQKLMRLPGDMDHERGKMRSAKLAYGTVHQVVMHEIGRRRRCANQERAAMVEKCFVDLAKQRLPEDVFQDLLDEAVEKTREDVAR